MILFLMISLLIRFEFIFGAIDIAIISYKKCVILHLNMVEVR